MAGPFTRPSKLPEVQTTIFTVMSQLAVSANALNLSQGFPAFDPPLLLTERIAFHMKSGRNQYAPMTGVQALRENLAAKTAQLYGVGYHPETEVTITSGATEALYAAITAFVRPGDEVIVLEPAYDSYVPAITLSGGRPVYLTLTPPEYRVDWQELKARLTERTSLILINTPHNPAGTVFSKSDIEALAAAVKGTDVLLISDEVYEHILFDGEKHWSPMMHPELRERTLVVGSFGKTFHATGWKTGYCMAPANLSAEVRKVHQFLTFSGVTAVQHALADVLQEPDYYLSLSAFYQHKRDLFLRAVAPSGFRYVPSKGTFFQSVCFGELSDEDDMTLAKRLTVEAGVASIPVSAFYSGKNDYKMLRFCFAKDDATLLQAGERLEAVKW